MAHNVYHSNELFYFRMNNVDNNFHRAEPIKIELSEKCRKSDDYNPYLERTVDHPIS